jgi:hypothetical protein
VKYLKFWGIKYKKKIFYLFLPTKQHAAKRTLINYIQQRVSIKPQHRFSIFHAHVCECVSVCMCEQQRVSVSALTNFHTLHYKNMNIRMKKREERGSVKSFFMPQHTARCSPNEQEEKKIFLPFSVHIYKLRIYIQHRRELK